MAKYEREKANKNTSRLTNDYEFEQYILDHNEFQLFYDKYGPIFLMAVKYLQSWRSAWIYVLEKHLFECFSFYFSLILPTIYVCKKYPYKRLKFLMNFLGIACFVLELEVTLQPFQADTLIDDYFPFLTAFEKIIMVKTTLICLLNAIVGYYAHIKRNKQMKIEEIFELIKGKNQKLFKPPPKRPKGKGDPSQIELGSIIEAIEPSMGKIQSYIEQEKQTNQTKKEKYNLLFYLIILSLLLNFIYNLPITQEYFIDLYKKSFVRENQSL